MENLPASETESYSLVSESSYESAISDYRPQFKTRKTKQLRSKRFKYQNIANDLRAALIRKVVDEKQKIKPTAKKLGINYSTAKSILQIYRKEGRIDKKLVPRSSDQLMSTTEEYSEERHPEEGLEQNLEGAHKNNSEQKRYSLRKRESLKSEALLLPSLQKQEQNAFEPRKVKKVKVAEKKAIRPLDENSSSENTENKEPQEALTPERNMSQCTTDHSPKTSLLAEAKGDDSLPRQPKLFHIPQPFVLRSPAAVSNDLPRQNFLQVVLPMLPNFNQPITSNNLLNLNIYGLLQSQLQQQASKLLLLSGNSHQNAPLRVPVCFQSNPRQNYLLQNHPLDFNQRINFKK